MTRHLGPAVGCLVGLLVAVAACGDRQEHVETTPTTSLVPITRQATAPTSPASAPSPRTETDRQAVLDAAREASGAPGAIAVLRAGDTEWSGFSGVADLSGTTLSPVTRFRIASITKPIVALLVLDAVERGELSLEDTVSDLLPGALREDPPTTVRMLLDHTSGIFNVGDEGDITVDITHLTDPTLRALAIDLGTRYLAGERVSMPDDLYVALAETHDRYFPPGTGFHYSNVNYQLAAMVVERATGKTLAQLLQERVVDVLGLHRTTIAPDDDSVPDLHGYGLDTDDHSLVDLTTDFLALGNGGSGGIISTADELLTIMQTIVAGDLIPAPARADMQQPSPPSRGQYGLGLARYPLSCGTFYGHAGAASGTHSIALVDDTGTTGTVIVVNASSTVDPNLLATAETLLCSTE